MASVGAATSRAESVSAHAPVSGDATAAADAAPAGRSTAAAGATGATAAPGTAATTGALSSAVQDASALYRRFTSAPPRSVQRVSHRRVMPGVVVELGQLVALMYRSDKWVGHPRTYIHYMEDPPRLVADVTGRQLFVVGGSYRITARGIEG